jgi:hypothetical protein
VRAVFSAELTRYFPTVSFQIAIGGASNGYCQISALAEVTILPAVGVVPSLAPPDRTIVVSVVRSPAGFLFRLLWDGSQTPIDS